MFHSLPCAIQMHPNYMWPQHIWKGARARIVFLILTGLNSHCSYCTGQQGPDEGFDNRNMSKVLGMAQISVCTTGIQRTGPGMLMPSWLRFTGWILRSKCLTRFCCPGRTLLKYTTQAPTVRASDKRSSWEKMSRVMRGFIALSSVGSERLTFSQP